MSSQHRSDPPDRSDAAVHHKRTIRSARQPFRCVERIADLYQTQFGRICTDGFVRKLYALITLSYQLLLDYPSPTVGFRDLLAP